MPSLLGAAAVVGVHDQAADLGGAVVGVADAEHLVDEVLVERGAVLLLAVDVEVDVRRAAAAELRDDHRGADGALALAGPAARRRTRARAGSSISPRNERSEMSRICAMASRSSGRLTVLRKRASAKSSSSSCAGRGADLVATHRARLCLRKLRSLSIRMVTGPSTWARTSMSARKRPVSTGEPERAQCVHTTSS